MGWYRTKSQHGFEKLVWLLPTYVTYGEVEISVCQLKDEYTVQYFVLSYFMVTKWWSLRVEYIPKLLVFNDRRLKNIAST
ncbi:unnamed protein product [Schistosoma mattheei]|uniref:Uncharacterized protein n=1 Tax=Schistosoma mattheei TaxID=31246 RepID=A0A183PFT6_9TREM|nr:unnamed protein product [Schistosoma mattheei]